MERSKISYNKLEQAATNQKKNFKQQAEQKKVSFFVGDIDKH